MEIFLAVFFWAVPGPVEFEWIWVADRARTVRLRWARWIEELAKLLRSLVARVRRSRDRETFSAFVTDDHSCPGGCGEIIGGGYILHERHWLRDLVSDHICWECAQREADRMLQALSCGRVRVNMHIRPGDILCLEIKPGSNKILGKGGAPMGVIVDED